jgi:hypothetical protein
MMVCASVDSVVARAPAAYFAPGYHGGYFLTSEGIFQSALDNIFDLLDTDSRFKVVLEIEPYTLQRMKGGEKFAFERLGRTEPVPAHWGLLGGGDYDISFSPEAARSGKHGIRIRFRSGYYAHALASVPAGKLRGRELIFSGWLRQREGRGAHLSIVHGPGAATRTEAVPADGKWHRVELRWKVPGNALRFFPQAKCEGEATDADFDDLSLRDAATGEELLPNGGFEETMQPDLRDPVGLERLRRFVRAGRIEIVGGAYAQPILYATGEESIVRNFEYGLRAVEEAVGSRVNVYAAQEPGMCSQLPQLLSEAGYEGLLYRTLWAIFGSPPHRDAEQAWWVGNDGSRIRTVPSYTATPLVRYHLTALPEPEVVEGLKAAGIAKPLFATLEDFLTEKMPEPGSPQVTGRFAAPLTAQVVTLGEYFRLTPKPCQEWPDAFHGFETRFPFGMLAGELQRADRASEDRLLQAERLAAMTSIDAGERLNRAWEAHLIGGHHDAWVCAPIIFGIWKQRTYAEVSEAAYKEAQLISTTVRNEAGCSPQIQGAEFSVINTSAAGRREVVRVKLTLPETSARQPVFATTSSLRSSAPCRINVVSRHADGSARDIEGVLLAEVPSLGFQQYRVIEGTSAGVPQVRVEKGEPAHLDNGLVRLAVSEQGVFVSGMGGDPVALFLAGDFPRKGSLKVPLTAEHTRIEDGAALASGSGEIGGVPFQATFRLDPVSPIVRISLEFDFGAGTDVGAQEDSDQERMPSHARDDLKLRLVLPLPFRGAKFFSHAPFEIRRVDTERYPLLRYAMAEGDQGQGVAVFTDRATAGVFKNEPASLEVVLAYGGRFLYAPNGNASLTGKQRFEMGLLLYRGGWQQSEIPKWSEVFSQPLLVRSGHLSRTEPLVRIEPEGSVIVTALKREGRHLLLRFWRPYEGEAEIRVQVAGSTHLRRTDLLHRSHQSQPDRLRLRQHQIVTLCARLQT